MFAQTTSAQPQSSPGDQLGILARQVARRYAPASAPNAAPCFPAPDGRYVFIQEAADLGVVHVQINAIPLNLVILDGGIVRRLHDPEREPERTDKILDISDPATTTQIQQAIDYLSAIP